MNVERLGWGEVREGDDALIEQLFQVLQRTETDQVLFFRDLARVPVDGGDDDLLAPLHDAWYAPEEVSGDVRALLQQAEEKFQEAERALQQGDLSGYAEASEAARELVEQALEAATDVLAGGGGQEENPPANG